MNIDHLVNNITPELYERLKHGAATGRWPEGVKLSNEQKAQTLQLVMLYQAKVEQSNEQFTISDQGEMVLKSKRELKSELAQGQEIARFTQNDL